MSEKKQGKTYFIDTNVSLHKGDVMFDFANKEGNKVMILDVLLEEIDRKKSEKGDVGRNARTTSTNLMKLSDRAKREGKEFIKEGTKTREGGEICLFSNYQIPQRLPKFHVDIGKNDLKIICAVLAYSKSHAEEDIRLVTMDKNLYIVAQENGITVEFKRGEQIDPRTMYSGFRLVKDEDLHAAIFQSSNGRYDEIKFDLSKIKNKELENLVTNEYVIFVTEETRQSIRLAGIIPQRESIFRYNIEDNTLRPIDYEGRAILGYKPKNFEQMLAFDFLLNDDIKVKPLVGEAGTGKTFIALLTALYKMDLRAGLSSKNALRAGLLVKENSRPGRIFITKRMVNVQNEDYGYLPGGMDDKNIMNYLGLKHNYEKIANGKKANETFENNNWPLKLEQALARDPPFIEILPLGIARGASLGPNDILIIEEAQNMESSAVRTLITRVGEGNGQVILTGDVTQTDNISTYKYDGLTHVVNAVHNTKDPRYAPILGALTLRQNERSDVSAWASKYLL